MTMTSSPSRSTRTKRTSSFTKLLLNVTLMSSAFATELASRRLAVLDPLCGRGTTLNQALMYGCDAAGPDADQRDFDAYSAFIKTWLKRKRIKHHAGYDGPVRRDGKVIGRRLQLSIGIAWNTLVAPREQATAILAEAGLEPLDSGPYLQFRHRVDQAIVRDVLVAGKPAAAAG